MEVMPDAMRKDLKVGGRLFDDLILVKEERIRYLTNENIDAMFLLEKMV